MDLEKAKNHVRVDFPDDDLYITELIEISEIYIDSCAGKAYKKHDEYVKLAEIVRLKLIQDMYDNRGTEISNKTKIDIIVTTILDKLSNCEDLT